ncbi:MAG TPA: hypothetical protein DDW52_23135 [Planctomycetaceae bacterium]|nr:hypothetical protein [Planctomycetaceae bacterium]
MELTFQYTGPKHYLVLVDGAQAGEIRGDFPFYDDVAWQGYFIVRGYEFNFGTHTLGGVIEVFENEIPEYLAFPMADSPKTAREDWLRLTSNTTTG